MKKTLSEAAADILKSSHSSAPAQAQQHLGAGSDQDDESDLGTGEDLGGDYPDEVKSDNPTYTRPIRGAKEPGPSPKVGQMAKAGLKSNNKHIPDINLQDEGPNTTGDELSHVKTTSTQAEEYEDDDEQMIEDDNTENDDENTLEEGEEESVILFDREALLEDFRENMEEELGDLLESDETLTEDFKKKAKAVFEAAVMSRVNALADVLETAFVGTLEEAINEIKNDLTEKTDEYLSYVAETWIQENELAIEKGLRTELTEDFIAGLKALFVEHYIDIPEDKIDVVQELANEVEEVETKLNEEIARSVELAQAVKGYQAQEIFTTVCEGLTDVQKDKLYSLAESLEFTTEEEFKEKLELIRENYFQVPGSAASKAGVTKTDNGLNEVLVHEDDEAKKVLSSTDHLVSGMANALDRASQNLNK